jgi:type IV fimbrial biogenesis protein FimT
MTPAHIAGKTPDHIYQGFTLLELMLTLAIIAVLARLALPALEFSQRNEATRVFTQLTSLLSNARATSIASHVVTVICPSLDGLNCDSNWTGGAISFIDNNNNRQRIDDDPLIDVLTWSQGGTRSAKILHGTLLWRAFGNRQSIRIDALGQLSDQNGSFSWCPAAHSSLPPQQMLINSAGRVRYASDTNVECL